LWEIQPEALEERIAGGQGAAIQVVDVREPSEFSDALGHIRGAHLLPLSSLAQRLGEIDRHRPVVTVCRSGVRSAQAAVMLQKAGLSQVANLAGGMLRWRAHALPVDNGSA
jgi:rhodanese-related sulfurtransferase